jgi:putative transposase
MKRKETPPMGKHSGNRSEKSRVTYEVLEEVVRMKVQELIQDILEKEITEFLGRRKSERIRKKVDTCCGYRNGYGKPRRLALMNGTIRIRRPRVRNTDEFESKVLPLFKRGSKEIAEVLPELYLHGLSKGDIELALRGLLGGGSALSPASIQRLKAKCQIEYEKWKNQDLSALKVVYRWADGVFVKAGLEKDKGALLVIIVALDNGQKVLLACESGYRESKDSWLGVLRDLRNPSMNLDPFKINSVMR